MKKIIICFLCLHGGILYSAEHKPQTKRHIEGMNALVQEWRDLHARKQQQHVGFDLPQRSRPIHDEKKAADPKKPDKEKK